GTWLIGPGSWLQTLTRVSSLSPTFSGTNSRSIRSFEGAGMRCSSCGSENPSDSAFCEQCGRKLELLCPACQAPISAGARFCRKCGTSLSATPVRSETIAASPSSGAGIRLFAGQTAADLTDGERKTVTVLFADLKGSTELMESLDPEEARAIVDPALGIM